MAQLSRLQREIISRGTMSVVALGLLLCGYKCVHAAHERRQGDSGRAQRPAPPPPTSPRRAPADPGPSGANAGFLDLVGGVLFVIGGVFVLMAVLPPETFGWLMGPPVGTTIGENSSSEILRRWLR